MLLFCCSLLLQPHKSVGSRKALSGCPIAFQVNHVQTQQGRSLVYNAQGTRASGCRLPSELTLKYLGPASRIERWQQHMSRKSAACLTFTCLGDLRQ